MFNTEPYLAWLHGALWTDCLQTFKSLGDGCFSAQVMLCT